VLANIEKTEPFMSDKKDKKTENETKEKISKAIEVVLNRSDITDKVKTFNMVIEKNEAKSKE